MRGKRFDIRLGDEEYREWQELASLNDMTVAELVRNSVGRSLEEASILSGVSAKNLEFPVGHPGIEDRLGKLEGKVEKAGHRLSNLECHMAFFRSGLREFNDIVEGGPDED